MPRTQRPDNLPDRTSRSVDLPAPDGPRIAQSPVDSAHECAATPETSRKIGVSPFVVTSTTPTSLHVRLKALRSRRGGTSTLCSAASSPARGSSLRMPSHSSRRKSLELPPYSPRRCRSTSSRLDLPSFRMLIKRAHVSDISPLELRDWVFRRRSFVYATMPPTAHTANRRHTSSDALLASSPN